MENLESARKRYRDMRNYLIAIAKMADLGEVTDADLIDAAEQLIRAHLALSEAEGLLESSTP